MAAVNNATVSNNAESSLNNKNFDANILKNKEESKESINGELDKNENTLNNTNGDEINYICIPQPVDELLLDDYQEPLLISLVSDCYRGCKKGGLLHGHCEVKLKGGHMFEGNFYEGKMHGEGCYTWADGTIYKGEFFMNNIEGIGRYTWTDGSSYVGAVRNGLRNGYGELNFANPNYLYKGNWKNGIMHGHGKFTFKMDDGSYYCGEWVEGQRDGRGVRRFISGDCYDGEWLAGKQHGLGRMSWICDGLVYEGQWKEGMQDGVGTYTWVKPRTTISQYTTRNRYHGDIKNNKREGYGIFQYANGASYDGCWKNNLKHGKGKYTFKNGRVFEGEFFEDRIIRDAGGKDGNLCQGNNNNGEGDTNNEPRTMTPFDLDQLSSESDNSYTSTWYFRFEFLMDGGKQVDWTIQNKMLVDVVTMRATVLNCTYSFYARLGRQRQTHDDNVYTLDEFRFFRLLKDILIQFCVCSLEEIDRLIGQNPRNKGKERRPDREIFYHEFVENLVIVSQFIYREETFAQSFTKLLTENLLKHACQLKGNFFNDAEKLNCVLQLLPNIYYLFEQVNPDRNMSWRQCILLLKDMDIFCHMNVSSVIDIIQQENPNIKNSQQQTNLELRVHWSDFIELFVGISQMLRLEEPPARNPVMNFDPNQEMEDIPPPVETKDVEQQQQSEEENIQQLNIPNSPKICYQPIILHPSESLKPDWSKQLYEFIIDYATPIIQLILEARKQDI